MHIPNRRKFLQNSGLTTAAVMIVPRHVLGGVGYKAPSDKLNIAGVGVGGVGKSYLENLASENIMALCDVDDDYAAKTYKTYPKAARYRDFRRMLETEKGIEAVVVGTPDHSHAVISITAMKMGKHVYCAKPLTRTIFESREMAKVAYETGVATQMSTQTNASEDHRLLCEWLWAGAIGPVRQVHTWSNRPIWPQGLERPKEQPRIPSTLDWDLWLGPAPYRPYHPAYHPFNFRGWWDFGTGALGDMGCHHLDTIFKAMKLGPPISIQASSTKLFPETAPLASLIQYEFPARGERPPVTVSWYDGGLKPPRPKELEDGRELGDWDGGMLFIGDRGTILCDGVGIKPRLIPESRMKEFQPPPRTLPRSIGHYREWIEACKGGKPAAVEFGYGSLLTEAALLGNLAIRSGKKLYWDHERLRITNDEKANHLIREPYREGWSI
jgi:predicted dehydrogenase